MKEFRNAQYLNYDNFNDARIISNQTWSLDADQLVLDEIHKIVLKKILIGPLIGPSPESIERAVIKIVGRGHPLFRKICVYLSYQRSGLNLREIGEYFGMQRSAMSQLSRRFAETIKGNQELRKVLSNIEKESLLNVAA